jgi:hypothetical protein
MPVLVLEVKVKILCCRETVPWELGCSTQTSHSYSGINCVCCVRSPFTCAHNSKLWAHDGPGAWEKSEPIKASRLSASALAYTLLGRLRGFFRHSDERILHSRARARFWSARVPDAAYSVGESFWFGAVITIPSNELNVMCCRALIRVTFCTRLANLMTPLTHKRRS